MAEETTAKRPRLLCSDSETSPAVRARLHYQSEVPGKRVGRYINTDDRGELADEHDVREMKIGSARDLSPQPTLDAKCFELRSCPTAVKSFKDDEEIRRVYYPEMEDLVKQASGAETALVFDHTVRDTGATSLNVQMGGTAAAVVRVHTDYSDRSGPERVKTLAASGGYTGLKLTDEQKDDILSREFCFINVWRNIKEEPVQTKPLAVLDPQTLCEPDFIPYEMQYAERKGENYALRYRDQHKWYYYPLMQKDECLLFKTWESRKDRPRYCFHTAFEDLDASTDPPPPPRNSIEVRVLCIMPKKEETKL